MKLEPYLFFNGRCDEAIEFYKSALGASVNMLMRFDDSPEPAGMPLPPGWGDKVMHASLQIGDVSILASDAMGPAATDFKGFGLSLTLPDSAAVTRAFEALAAGGTINMPVGKTFWSPCFGMVVDRFGVSWMLGVPA